MKFDIRVFFEKSVENTQVLLKSAKNNNGFNFKLLHPVLLYVYLYWKIVPFKRKCELLW